MKNQLTVRLACILALVIGAAVFAACGGMVSKNANSGAASNANSSNKANSTSTAKTSDMPPLTISLDNLQLAEEAVSAAEHPNRILIVTGYLNFVNDNEFALGYARGTDLPGVSVTCKGDFAKYSDLKPLVEKLTKDSKAPEATVQGAFKEFKNDAIVLEPCVLMKIEK